MPISVVCGSCQAKLNAPDAAAGKTVKCPKCKAAITVPDPAAAQFEVVDEAPAPAPKKKAVVVDDDDKPKKKKPVVVEDDDDEDEDRPKKKRAVVEDDDEEGDKPRKKKPVVVEDDDEEDEKPKKKKRSVVEDDEDDEDRPKKKKKKKAVSAVDSGNMVRTIIGIVVLLVALGIAAFVWWDRSRKQEENEKANNGDTPGQSQTPSPGPPRPGPTPPAPQPGPGKDPEVGLVMAPRAKFQAEFPTEADGMPGGFDSGQVQEPFLSADGSMLAVANFSLKNRISRFWSLGDTPKKLRDHDGKIRALSPDGKHFFRDVNNIVSTETWTSTGSASFISDAVWFRTNDSVLGLTRGEKTGTIRECDLTGKDLGSIETPERVQFSYSGPVKDGSEFFIGFEDSKLVRGWNLGDRQKKSEFKAPPQTSWTGFRASADGRWIAVGVEYPKIAFIDAATGNVAATLNGPYQSIWGGFAAGKDIYLVPKMSRQPNGLSESLEVVAFDIKKKAIVSTFGRHDKPMKGMRVSENGKVMVTGDVGGTIMVWDLSRIP